MSHFLMNIALRGAGRAPRPPQPPSQGLQVARIAPSTAGKTMRGVAIDDAPVNRPLSSPRRHDQAAHDSRMRAVKDPVTQERPPVVGEAAPTDETNPQPLSPAVAPDVSGIVHVPRERTPIAEPPSGTISKEPPTTAPLPDEQAVRQPPVIDHDLPPAILDEPNLTIPGDGKAVVDGSSTDVPPRKSLSVNEPPPIDPVLHEGTKEIPLEHADPTKTSRAALEPMPFERVADRVPVESVAPRRHHEAPRARADTDHPSPSLDSAAGQSAADTPHPNEDPPQSPAGGHVVDETATVSASQSTISSPIDILRRQEKGAPTSPSTIDPSPVAMDRPPSVRGEAKPAEQAILQDHREAGDPVAHSNQVPRPVSRERNLTRSEPVAPHKPVSESEVTAEPSIAPDLSSQGIIVTPHANRNLPWPDTSVEPPPIHVRIGTIEIAASPATAPPAPPRSDPSRGGFASYEGIRSYTTWEPAGGDR